LKKSEILFLIVALILAAAVGGLIGDIIGSVAPKGNVKTLLEKEIPIGFQTISFDWYALSFTIGFLIRLNFFSILGMVLVIIYFKWWHLS